jgi:PleD family two-component response regulator
MLSARQSDSLRKKTCILVVDDAPEVTQLVASWLRDDYSVFTAARGDEALRVAEIVHPRVALLDIVMPRPNGFELAEMFREHPRLSGTGIIFITGLRDPANAMRAIELGALDFLYKPIDEDTVRERVRAAVEMREDRA